MATEQQLSREQVWSSYRPGKYFERGIELGLTPELYAAVDGSSPKWEQKKQAWKLVEQANPQWRAVNFTIIYAVPSHAIPLPETDSPFIDLHGDKWKPGRFDGITSIESRGKSAKVFPKTPIGYFGGRIGSSMGARAAEPDTEWEKTIEDAQKFRFDHICFDETDPADSVRIRTCPPPNTEWQDTEVASSSVVYL